MKYSGTERPDIDKEMVCVKVEIRERTVVRRVRITAGSIERALSMAGRGRSERKVSLVLPTDAGRPFTREARRTPEGSSSGATFAQAA